MKTIFKRSLLAAAIGAAVVGLPAQAQMAPPPPPVTTPGVGYLGLPNSGIVHFFGRVRDAACTATVNGAGATGYVILPDALVGDFPAVGDTFPKDPVKFFIELRDCPKAEVTAWPYFFAGHSNSTTGRLNNIPGIGQAIGVDLQLYDLTTDPANPAMFKVYQGENPFGNAGPNLVVAGDGPHTIDYGVKYYRAAGITPGAIRSNVDYIVFFK